MNLRSLPLRLFTLLALPLLVLLLLVTFGSVTLHRAAMRDLATNHDVQAVRSITAGLSGRLEQKEAVLREIATRAVETRNKPCVLQDWSETLFDGGIALYDSGGNLIAATENVDAWQPYSGPLPADLGQALAEVPHNGEALYIPIIEPGRNATRIAVVLSPAPTADGESLVVIGVVSLDALDLPITMEMLRTSEFASILLATREGQIVYATDPTLVGSYLPRTSYVDAALRGESDADYDSSTLGEQIVSYAPVPETGWTLIQEDTWTALLSPLMRYSQVAALVLVPGLVIAIAAAWFAINAVVRPLQKLEARAADLARGNFESIEEPVGGIEEIERLQQSLRLMAGQLEKAQELMRTYIGAITRAQEDERRRLARDLHDHMVQALIALDHREQMLKKYLSDDPAGAELLSELREMTAEAIDDLRRIIRAMRPIYLEDLGLLPALEALARDISASGDADVHFEKLGTPRRLPPEEEITLYRVAQEALNNARRHSQATNIWLTLRFEPESVAVSVRDNGKGFRAPRRMTDLPRNGHFGLIGMYERAELAGADLKIDSALGKGTTVTIEAETTSAS
jgi:signal transduction histidine kinase